MRVIHLRVPEPDHSLIGPRHGHGVEQVETVESDVDTLYVVLPRSAEDGETAPCAQLP